MDDMNRQLWHLALTDQAITEMYPDFTTPRHYRDMTDEEIYKLKREESMLAAYRKYNRYREIKRDPRTGQPRQK